MHKVIMFNCLIKVLEGLVVAVGPGARNSSTGAHIPMSVAVGDKVMLPEYGGSKIELENQVSKVSNFHRTHPCIMVVI